MSQLSAIGHVNFSEDLLKEGRELFEKGAVRDVQFAEGVYQIAVKPPKSKKNFFPVVHLDDRGRLIDAFCECEDSERENSCVHIVAAYLKIFENSSLPLHVRFKNSFWRALCYHTASRHNFLVEELEKKGKDTWCIHAGETKILFSIRALNEKARKQIQDLLSQNNKQQENSLKFSSLSTEEHFLWRERRAPADVRFRLSFWNDFSELLFMRAQEEKRYKASFIEMSKDSEMLPKGVAFRFKDFEVIFSIAKEDWPDLIPKLATVSTPLKVYSSHYAPIQAITYDKKARAFHLELMSTPLLEKGDQEKPILFIGDWFYIPDLGFFPIKCDPLLGKKVISQQEIGHFLEAHGSLVEQTLVGTRLHQTPRALRYHLKFLEKEGLEIEGYLFEKGDLTQQDTAIFGSWIYLPEKGFYTTTSIYSKIKHVIPFQELSAFIAGHRLFLNDHEGFQIHLTTIEASLGFHLDQRGDLHFDLSVEEEMEQEGIVDLGDWVYIKGRGFYPKGKQGGAIRAGLIVSREEISGFIDRHRTELETLTGFFASRCPVEASGVSVFLNDENKIVVRPRYQIFPSISSEDVRILGDYSFIEKEGFYEIPASMRLPEPYTQEKTISFSNEAHFVMHQLEMLKPFLLELDDRLVKPEKLVLEVDSLKKSSGANPVWHVEFAYKSKFGKINLTEVYQAIDEGKSYLFTEAGLLMLSLPRFTWLRDLSSGAVKKDRNRVSLSAIECLKLAAFEEIEDTNGSPITPEAWQQLLEAGIKKEEPSLEGLKSTLRTYQAKGLEWLWMLQAQGLSGLLCDEMGLGKTHQAMALIAALRNKAKQREDKRELFLVVCPTSVIFHWQELFKRFLPDAKVLIFHGVQRNLTQLEEDPEIVVTSYGILRSERALFKRLPITLAIYDEIQVAKNTGSITHRALKQVQAKMRLGLTGTPIENRLLDLKALFDVVLPKYLPSDARFEQLFGFDSDWEQDPKRKELLKQLIKPFVLRRKKSEVLTELPEKTEDIYYCTLSAEQSKLYKSAFRQDGEALLEDLRDTTKSFSYIHIFSLLSRLKQICNHPCLVLPEDEDFFAHDSGKWDLFVELLNEARESGQKVVVFSQFLKMLDIIEAYLDERGIGHAGIRGSTRDRQAEVQRFRDDPCCEVFVASLQAAGVGIDLVAASVVIHYDRWWNPAKENQATDRVHRIGQQRGVQVFKLVVKNTIEEHIDKLIERKMKLMREAIAYDDQDTLKQFDRGELIELLQQSMQL